MSLASFLGPKKEFLPGSTDFDHLHSQYLALKADIPAGADKEELERICELRADKKTELPWKEIYAFELLLLKYLKLPSLRNKVIGLRDRYVNVFGQDKYRTYLETKLSDPTAEVPAPPDGTADPSAWRQQKETELTARLREDCNYLLDQIYRAYDTLTAREGLGKWLTICAAYLVLLAVTLGALLLLPGPGFVWKLYLMRRSPVVIVFFAGALGGLISILQRLQTVATEGDPIYSLTAFWNGSYALFVSPLTGAVFGVLLYLIFAGTILQGKFFPNIATPSHGTDVLAPCSATPTPTPNPAAPTTTLTPPPAPPTTQTPTTTAATTTTAAAAPTGTTAPAANGNTNQAVKPGTATGAATSTSATDAASKRETAKETATATPAPSPAASPTPAGSTAFGRFLKCAGPASGLDYALLIIWCFIAGFAERLVPDTLNRLVDEKDNKTTAKKS